MKIGQYLRARRRTTLVALLFPVLAAAGAFLVLHGQPRQYTAMATVGVPARTASSASSIGVFVANFAQVARSVDVDREVQDATHEPSADLATGLDIARIGESSLFTVAYTGTHPAAVEPVVRSVIARSMVRLVGRTNADLDNAFEVASRSYDQAVADRQAFQNEIGTIQPERDYADVSSRLRALQSSPATLTSASTIATLTGQRDALVPKVRRAAELDQAVTVAASQRDDANRAASDARKEAVEAQSPAAIRDLIVTPGSTTSRLAQGVGVAALAGLLCGIALLVLPDLLFPRRAAAQHARAQERAQQAEARQAEVHAQAEQTGAPARPTSLTRAHDAG